MSGEHAVLSPSSAERWIACPPSVQMAERHKREETESFFAREGTAAHALAEIYGLHAVGKTSADEKHAAVEAWRDEFSDVLAQDLTDVDEMFRTAEDYVQLINRLASRYDNAQIMFEQRMATGVPQSWGTSDAVIVSPDAVHIVDLKYGKGIEVSAAGNSQLRLYALGALDTYGDVLGDTRSVAYTVYQPRLGNTDTEETTPEEIRTWREEVVLPAARAALSIGGASAEFGPGEVACRWCPVAGACRARSEYMAELDFGTEADVLDNVEMSEILPRLNDLRRWADAVEQEALQRAYTEGRQIPGHKVVLRGGRRVIKDDAFAIQKLIDAGYNAEQVSSVRVKGVGALEKLLGRDEFAAVLGDLITKTEGKPAVVPESTAGTPVTAASRAAEDFADADNQ